MSLGNDIRADYGRAQDDRTHVFAATGTFNVWRTLNIATVVSAILRSPVNEVTGRTGTATPTVPTGRSRAWTTGRFPIRSELDAQGRAVINGLEGPGSFLVDMSVRYRIPLQGGARGVDLFMDVFNLLNRENLTQPTGNRRSSNFMISTAAQFARQPQFGIRLRF